MCIISSLINSSPAISLLSLKWREAKTFFSTIRKRKIQICPDLITLVLQKWANSDDLANTNFQYLIIFSARYYHKNTLMTFSYWEVMIGYSEIEGKKISPVYKTACWLKYARAAVCQGREYSNNEETTTRMTKETKIWIEYDEKTMAYNNFKKEIYSDFQSNHNLLRLDIIGGR